MHSTASAAIGRLPRPRRSTVVYGLVLVNVQALFLLSYASINDRPFLDPFLFYPLVWIDVGLWALIRTDPVPASRRRRVVAAAVAVGYFLLLALASNMLGPGEALARWLFDASWSDYANPAFGWEFRLVEIPPGWAPTAIYNGALVHISLIPPYVVGFVALAYMVYATVLETAGAASAGVFALFSCVACTLPIYAAILGSLTGVTTSAILSLASTYAYPAGAALFVTTVALLHWRPGFRSTVGDR